MNKELDDAVQLINGSLRQRADAIQLLQYWLPFRRDNVCRTQAAVQTPLGNVLITIDVEYRFRWFGRRLMRVLRFVGRDYPDLTPDAISLAATRALDQGAAKGRRATHTDSGDPVLYLEVGGRSRCYDLEVEGIDPAIVAIGEHLSALEREPQEGSQRIKTRDSHLFCRREIGDCP